MAIDLAPIRVNTVSPGAIHTPLLDKFIQKVGEEVSEGFKTKGSLLGTWGTPEDVAEAYGWFMKDRFVTGMVADSSGGRMLA
jgi:NAD(P)-dependent dehydrogenase (short-subunit alcohol dehydrogenase family)